MSADKNGADNRPYAILLMGPTAAGKTDLAVFLAEHLPCDIVSVDSALVYRDMDIGTAKPDAQTLSRVPHRLIDILDPAEAYSAGTFRADALREMTKIAESGRTPLLVGGTMLYFRVLTRGIAVLPVADPALRARLDARADQLGWPALHAELARLDPRAAERIHPNDRQRIQRALEVASVSGETMSALLERAETEVPAWRFLRIGLLPQDRAGLHRRIEVRFNIMIEKGFVDEVAALRARGDLHLDLPSMRAVGYRQVWQYLDGDHTLEQARLGTLGATRALARRQLTWLRGEDEIIQVDSGDASRYTRALEAINRTLPGL